MSQNYSISNDYLKITVASLGAELQQLQDKTTQQDYLWDGDPEYWAKRSPVLFPIVGALKDHTYYYNHNGYHLGRHGFAREMEFSLINQHAGMLQFELCDSEATRKVYPFLFSFVIRYELVGPSLQVHYSVTNTGAKTMYFSVGAHPAFKVPMKSGETFSEYEIAFEEKEDAPIWPIAPGGLIGVTPTPFLQNSAIIPLTKDLFSKDALVFKNIRSQKLQLRSVKTQKGIEFGWKDFPYLGIWSAPGADFVCIEPWCGIADSVDSNQALVHKEGIQELESGSVFERNWNVTIY